MKIAILGFGKEGKSALNYFKKQGFTNIDILDAKENSNYLSNLEKYDLIFKSPGISIYLPALQKVKDKLTSSADILFEKFKGKLILVSGSKGKSTTSSLMYEFLKKAGKNVKLVGNIGNPILDEIDFDNQPDYVVFEISSYMLDSAKNVWASYSILTNIYNVHTKWHQNHQNYVNAKLKILNVDKLASVNVALKNLLKEKNVSLDKIKFFGPNTDYYFDEKFIYSPKYKIETDKILLGGNHNYQNIASCLPILELEGISHEVVEETLKEFVGLPHRQEFVAEINGVKFYNDSISTISESVMQVLDRFPNLETLILGGQDVGYEYGELIKKINQHGVKNIILLPDCFEKYKSKFVNKEIYETDTLEKAVNLAKKITSAGNVCVLSPGAPSLNMFKNFEERGNLFKRYVLAS